MRLEIICALMIMASLASCGCGNYVRRNICLRQEIDAVTRESFKDLGPNFNYFNSQTPKDEDYENGNK